MSKKHDHKGKPGQPKAPKVPRDPNEEALRKLYGDTGANAGNALINKFLQPGALGRVQTALPGSENDLGRYQELYNSTSQRDPMQADVLNRMQAGLGGYTSPEYQAQREQMMRGVQSNTATGLQQLAKSQARGKVYGAAASAQAGNLLTGAQQSKDTLEQDLMVKNIDEQQKRLTEYGQYGRGLNEEEFGRRANATQAYGDEEGRLRQEELDREKINLGQTNAELAAQIGAFTGAGGLALQQKNTEESQKIQRKGINAVAGTGGTKNEARRRANRRMAA